MSALNESDRKVLQVVQEALPRISERDKEKLTAFLLGLNFAVEPNSKAIQSLAAPNE